MKSVCSKGTLHVVLGNNNKYNFSAIPGFSLFSSVYDKKECVEYMLMYMSYLLIKISPNIIFLLDLWFVIFSVIFHNSKFGCYLLVCQENIRHTGKEFRGHEHWQLDKLNNIKVVKRCHFQLNLTFSTIQS